MSRTSFNWIEPYEKIATALLDYEDKQPELCSVVEDVLGESYDVMDPLTFFSMFNGKRRNRDKRIEAVEKVLNALGIDTDPPSDFEGVPLTNPQRWRYCNGNSDTVEHNWELFKAALAFAGASEEPEFPLSYDVT